MFSRPVTENPLYNENKMKIGIIAMNCSHGSTISQVEGAWEMNWPDTREVAVMADRASVRPAATLRTRRGRP